MERFKFFDVVNLINDESQMKRLKNYISLIETCTVDEKILESISMEEFLEKFNTAYGWLYDNVTECPTPDIERYAVIIFDELRENHDWFLLKFVRYRGDIVVSDREASAFIYALTEYL